MPIQPFKMRRNNSVGNFAIVPSKKYVIFAIPRTGSTLYSNLLNNVRKTSLYDPDFHVEYTGGEKDPEWSLPILHTHQLAVFESAPADYVKLISTRCILDSVASYLVAQHTDAWTMIGDDVKHDYIEKFKHAKIAIDIKEFGYQCQEFDETYGAAFRIFYQATGEKHILSYNVHAKDHEKFYQALDIKYQPPQIDPDQLPPQWLIRQMPIDKFSMIENLSEVLEAYQSMSLTHKFDDASTIRTVENILKTRATAG